MHVKTLKRGEAIFVSPGEMHAYLEGFGLEVMLPSDNVVREGLTTKHRDSDVFFAIAALVATEEVPLVTPSAHDGMSTYQPDGAAFKVSRVGASATYALARDAIVVVESGPVNLQGVQGSIGLSSGDVVFATSSEEILEFEGNAVSWVIEGVK
jgi:mannose-6-phosphate isomerase